MRGEVRAGFLQALGVVAYISLVATVLQNAEKLFDELDRFLAPILFLSLLSTSVLICAFVVGYYPVKLFWIKKSPQKAIEVVGYTILFLLLFILTIFGIVGIT